MPVSLPKGANVSLSKQAPGLEHIVIGLGWDARTAAGGPGLELDASLFMLKGDGRASNAGNRFYPEGWEFSYVPPQGWETDERAVEEYKVAYGPQSNGVLSYQ